MIIAMMLPGTLLLIARCWGNGAFSASHITPMILTYVIVWTVFGSFSYLGDSALHVLVDRMPALAGVIAPGILLLAGVYQLSPMKRACQSRCRSEGAVFEAPGQSSRRDLWTTGLQHGAYCLGSCWALMLLMFAIGGINLMWMLLLGVIMAAERTMHRGQLLARFLGFCLILGACMMLLS